MTCLDCYGIARQGREWAPSIGEPSLRVPVYLAYQRAFPRHAVTSAKSYVSRFSLVNYDALETAACIPEPVDPSRFNESAILPCGCTVEHVRLAMQDFLNFLGFINTQLNTRALQRLEVMLMPANFSSLVGEFATSAIPKYCPTLVKNRFHNGHPDLIPADMFANDAVQYAHSGIEVKASRYMSGWQGHNPEESWLMVFVFSAIAIASAGLFARQRAVGRRYTPYHSTPHISLRQHIAAPRLHLQRRWTRTP